MYPQKVRYMEKEAEAYMLLAGCFTDEGFPKMQPYMKESLKIYTELD